MEVVLGIPPSILSMSLDFLAITLIIFALMGIYGFQTEETGVYGFLGFLLTVLMSCIGLSVISWSPESTEVAGAAGMLIPLMGIAGLFGYILLGIGSWKANKLPRWIVVLWPIGTVISAIGMMLANSGFENANYLHVIGISVWGLGFIGAGVKLWSGMVEPASQPEAAT
jgi:ABC-type multidrug transport system permease subunit